MSRRAYIAFIVMIGLCLLPLLGVWWSIDFADRHGCIVNEAASHPCIVNGRDWGDILATAFVGGWFMLVTLPAAAFLALALVIVGTMDLIKRRRARSRGTSAR